MHVSPIQFGRRTSTGHGCFAMDFVEALAEGMGECFVEDREVIIKLNLVFSAVWN